MTDLVFSPLPGPPDREYTVAVPGGELYVAEVGSGDPIVLLHGGPAASHDYLRPQMDQLSEGKRRLVYYDQRGGGRSPLTTGAASATAADHVADLEALRLHLDVPRLRLVGYSWGGLLSLLYALEHRESVDRMALMSSAPSSAASRGTMLENLRRNDQRREVAELKAALDLPELSVRDPAAARRARFALAVTGYFLDPRLALQLTPFRVTQRSEQAIWASLGEFDLRPRLPSLRGLPILMLHGREDPIPLATAMETAELTGARLVAIDHAGHVPYIEAPRPLFSALESFI